MTDTKFWYPSYSNLWELVVSSFIDKYKYAINQFECEEFSIILSAFVKQERYKQIQKRNISKEQWLSWSFGEIYGEFGNGGHAMNICLCDDNVIYLIEPQNDMIRKVNTSIDKAYFIRV